MCYHKDIPINEKLCDSSNTTEKAKAKKETSKCFHERKIIEMHVGFL